MSNMSNKHTPGPWTNTPMQDTIWANDGDTKIATIADLPWINGKSDWMTEQANAQLIAAAPDMLAALKGILAALTQNATLPADIEYCRIHCKAAIAQAEKGQS